MNGLHKSANEGAVACRKVGVEMALVSSDIFPQEVIVWCDICALLAEISWVHTARLAVGDLAGQLDLSDVVGVLVREAEEVGACVEVVVIVVS